MIREPLTVWSFVDRSWWAGARQGRRARTYQTDMGATEDAASRRPARPIDSRLHAVRGFKGRGRLECMLDIARLPLGDDVRVLLGMGGTPIAEPLDGVRDPG